jgi:hypothetical protein
MESENDRLVGLLMVDRPQKAKREWLEQVEETFGYYQLAPMTTSGARGIVYQMSIEKDSMKYLREFPQEINERISEALYPLLMHRPIPRLRVWWDEDYSLWLSEFDI